MWTSAADRTHHNSTINTALLRNIATIAIALAFGSIAMAQQEVMVSQYMFNGLFINPAYAGSHAGCEIVAVDAIVHMVIIARRRLSLLGGHQLARDAALAVGPIRDEALVAVGQRRAVKDDVTLAGAERAVVLGAARDRAQRAVACP
mgnify:CR=1 FL=1